MADTDRSELTRWVAEHAMGWEWRKWGDYGWWENSEGAKTFSFDPCTKIEHAWLLVDQMRERNAHFVMGSFPSGQTTVWFVDEIWAIGKKQNAVPHQDDPACLGSYTADTVAEAITLACRAALEATK